MPETPPLEADEREIRNRLRALGVGPDAIPPKPTVRPRDWLDDLLDTQPAPEPEPAEEQPQPAPAAPEKTPEPPKKTRTPKPRKKQKQPKPGTPRAGVDSRPAPVRQSLADAWGQVPPRLKWLAYHASAAVFGWWLGWVGWATDTAAWYAAGHWTTPSAWVLYGLGVCTCALYSKTRSWRLPVAWMAAVPVTSIVVGVLLYAPHP